MQRMFDKRLPFPTRPLRVRGGVVEEHIIPEEQKAEVLAALCPFEPVPDINSVQLDLHEDKIFVVREFRVTWENGMNWVVSPYYPHSGGTLIDWWPVHEDDPSLVHLDEDWEEEEEKEEEIDRDTA